MARAQAHLDQPAGAEREGPGRAGGDGREAEDGEQLLDASVLGGPSPDAGDPAR